MDFKKGFCVGLGMACGIWVIEEVRRFARKHFSTEGLKDKAYEKTIGAVKYIYGKTPDRRASEKDFRDYQRYTEWRREQDREFYDD